MRVYTKLKYCTFEHNKSNFYPFLVKREQRQSKHRGVEMESPVSFSLYSIGPVELTPFQLVPRWKQLSTIQNKKRTKSEKCEGFVRSYIFYVPT